MSPIDDTSRKVDSMRTTPNVESKIASLTDFARSSIFFPFTESTVRSPVSGKKVSGRKMKKFNAKKLIWGN